MLDVLIAAAAIVTIVGGTASAFRALQRKRRKSEARTSAGASLIKVVTDFTGRALSAHGRLVLLGKLQASWFPVSEATASRFGEPLLREAGPIASLRGEVALADNSNINQAADDVLRVLEETAALLTERKGVLRRVQWENREAAIRDAVHGLEKTARAHT